MPESTVIAADNHWGIWATLITLAALGLWAEKTHWGKYLSGAVVAILGAFMLSNLSIIPPAAPAYDVVWGYIVPLAIPMLLYKANLRQIMRESGPTLIAFTFGAIGTVLGTIIAFNLIPLGGEGWKLAGIFCSTYIGGSMNFVASSEALQFRNEDLLAAGIAADNLVMTLYFLVLVALPSIAVLRRNYVKRHDGLTELNSTSETEFSQNENLTLLSSASGLAVSAVACAVGFALQDVTGIRGSGILYITALIVLLATVFPRQAGSLAGSDRLGILLMQIFFATIGASANFLVVLKVGPILFVFAAIILFIHLIFLLIAGKLAKLDLAEIVIASNANMGGPTTAAAMAVARRWQTLVIPAILCGTLGYAMATFIGVGVGYWLR